MKYYYSPMQNTVLQSTGELNKTRIYGDTPEQAIKRYFAHKRAMADAEEKEALARLSKEIMSNLSDRD